MKRSPLFIITVLFIFAQSAFCASGNGQDEKSDFSAAAVNIAFFDRTMYYPSVVKDNPVYVNVSIKNTGTQTLRFKLADDRAFSLDFSARSVKNKFLPSNKDLIITRSVNQTVYFREISIEPGEAYSFVENVKDYIQFDI